MKLTYFVRPGEGTMALFLCKMNWGTQLSIILSFFFRETTLKAR